MNGQMEWPFHRLLCPSAGGLSRCGNGHSESLLQWQEMKACVNMCMKEQGTCEAWMSGVKHRMQLGKRGGNDKKRARKLCRAEYGGLRLRGMGRRRRYGWGGGGSSRTIDSATREKINFAQQEKMKVLVVPAWFPINPWRFLYDCIIQAHRVYFHVVVSVMFEGVPRLLDHFSEAKQTCKTATAIKLPLAPRHTFWHTVGNDDVIHVFAQTSGTLLHCLFTAAQGHCYLFKS